MPIGCQIPAPVDEVGAFGLSPDHFNGELFSSNNSSILYIDYNEDSFAFAKPPESHVTILRLKPKYNMLVSSGLFSDLNLCSNFSFYISTTSGEYDQTNFSVGAGYIKYVDLVYISTDDTTTVTAYNGSFKFFERTKELAIIDVQTIASYTADLLSDLHTYEIGARITFKGDTFTQPTACPLFLHLYMDDVLLESIMYSNDLQLKDSYQVSFEHFTPDITGRFRLKAEVPVGADAVLDCVYVIPISACPNWHDILKPYFYEIDTCSSGYWGWNNEYVYAYSSLGLSDIFGLYTDAIHTVRFDVTIHNAPGELVIANKRYLIENTGNQVFDIPWHKRTNVGIAAYYDSFYTGDPTWQINSIYIPTCPGNAPPSGLSLSTLSTYTCENRNITTIYQPADTRIDATTFYDNGFYSVYNGEDPPPGTQNCIAIETIEFIEDDDVAVDTTRDIEIKVHWWSPDDFGPSAYDYYINVDASGYRNSELWLAQSSSFTAGEHVITLHDTYPRAIAGKFTIRMYHSLFHNIKIICVEVNSVRTP